MPDWLLLLLAPALVAIVALPLLFIGCTTFGEAPPQTGTIPGPPLLIAKDTEFQLNLGPDLLRLYSGVSPTNYPDRVDVVFSLFDKASEASTTIKLVPPPITPTTPGSPQTLKPDIDPPTRYRASDGEIGVRNGVRCTCKVSLTGNFDINAPTPPLTAAVIDVTKGYRHVFRLDAARIPGQPQTRAFQIVFESSTGISP